MKRMLIVLALIVMGAASASAQDDPDAARLECYREIAAAAMTRLEAVQTAPDPDTALALLEAIDLDPSHCEGEPLVGEAEDYLIGLIELGNPWQDITIASEQVPLPLCLEERPPTPASRAEVDLIYPPQGPFITHAVNFMATIRDARDYFDLVEQAVEECQVWVRVNSDGGTLTYTMSPLPDFPAFGTESAAVLVNVDPYETIVIFVRQRNVVISIVYGVAAGNQLDQNYAAQLVQTALEKLP